MLKLKSWKNFKNGPFLIPVLCFMFLFLIVGISVISSFIVLGLENPRDGILLSALLTLIISGIISGFSSAKICGNIKEPFIALGIIGTVIIVFGCVFGNPTGAFLNAVCFVGSGMLSAAFSGCLGVKKRHRR